MHNVGGWPTESEALGWGGILGAGAAGAVFQKHPVYVGAYSV